MSPETEKLLTDFKTRSYSINRTDIRQFAEPRHHEAIPVLIGWLQDYSWTEAVDENYQTVPFAEFAADALKIIGEPAVPDLLAHLEANLQTPNWYLIEALHPAKNLPDMTPFVTYYRNFLPQNPYLAANVRKLIEKHTPNTELVTAEMLPKLRASIPDNDADIHPEILYHLRNMNDTAAVPYLIEHLRTRRKHPTHYQPHYGRDWEIYNWNIVLLIRQLGTSRQTLQATLTIWRDIAADIALRFGCLLALMLPFVIIGIVWAVLGWIWGLMCIVVPVVAFTVFAIVYNHKNCHPLARRK